MPKRPISATFSNSSADVMNAIRNSASINYRNRVPIVTPNADSIRTIGAIICDDTQLYNEFINTLATRIYKVIITNKLYENPWQKFKKGIVELGEKTEDIFIDLAKPFTFDPENAYANEFKRELPNVKTAFYVMNYQKFYKVTTSREELRTAFLSMDGLSNFITKCITALYTSANYDEYQVMKYLVARTILNGRLYPVTGGAISADGAKAVVSAAKQVSNDITFMSNKYNPMGVYNYTDKDNQYILIDSKFDAIMDVNVLATAFNMDKTEFIGHRTLIDGFGNLDTTRLAQLFDYEHGDSAYTPLTDDEVTLLNTIPCCIVDENFFQVYDNLIQTGVKDVQEGLYLNNWLHRWATFATSAFSNQIVITPSSATVSSVTVSPSTLTLMAGQTGQLSATVAVSGIASKEVVWSVPDGAKATITQEGKITLKSDAVEGSTITVTAKSKANANVSGTCTVTVADLAEAQAGGGGT